MRVGLLGPLEVHDEAGRAITVGGPRLRALLIRLALDPGRLVGAAALADAVWPTGPPPGAANALQALVSRLRRLLPPGALVSQPAGYLLAVEPWAVDAVRFEALAARGRAAASRDPLGAAAILREALALWRGAALVDVATADFARSPVARLTELRLSALEDRCAADLAAGAAPDVIPELRALVAAQPLRERSAGLLIRALASAGRPAEALAAYERCRAAFAETLGTEPSPALAALHLAVLRGEPPATAVADGAPVSAAPGAGGGQGNLPAPLTTFVGRDHEVTRVAKLVAESRLTTLTGPGGAGKTRLATECARTALPDLPDGAWLVELAPILDPAEVPLAALSALGLRERPLLTGPTGRAAHEDPDPVARLAVGIAGRHLLLVLDNCEHVIGAAAALADRLLARCPHLRVLTTSREPLGITGETLWPVEPLALPPADAPPGEALGYPAVRLLADRAQAVRPDFAVDDRTVRDVVTICRALDGMPLAIELAAARLRALPVREVAARLDDRFRLLTAGSRTARPRHQTLRAVVDWSWDLLDEAERALWRGLAVFAGGATVAAAERVCAGPGLPAAEVLDRLAALVDKSLVVAMPDGRYGMLETIRAYGLERLVEAGAEDALRRAHATAFLALAEELAAGLRGGEQLGCLARLTADHDNVHAALRWAIAAGDAALATRFAAALGWYWWLRGRRGEGADLAAMAFALTGPVPPAVAGLAYALAAMNVAGGRSDVARAHRWLTRAAALARRAGPAAPGILRVAAPIAGLFRPGAEAAGLSALRTLFDDPDRWAAAVARVMHAHGMLNAGRPAVTEAEADLAAALADFRAVGDRWGMALVLSSLADLAARRGDHARAAAHHREALDVIGPVGALADVPQMQLRLAHALWLLGDHAAARELVTEAERLARRTGADEALGAVAYVTAEFARADGDLDGARATLAAWVRLGHQPGAPQWRAVLASAFGYLDAATGDTAAARARHAEALEVALLSQDSPIVAHVLIGVADLALRTGRPADAATLLGAAVAVRGGPDLSHLDEARVAGAAREALGAADFDEAYARGGTATARTARPLAETVLGP